MSVKIYDGLRAVETDPFAVAAALRAVLEPAFFAQIDYVIATYAMVNDPFRIARAIHQFYRDPTDTLDPLSLGYQAILLPSPAQPLVLLQGQRVDYLRRALLEAGVVTEYPYWDNVDVPGDADWEERKQIWGNAMAYQGKAFDEDPPQAGLSITYPSTYRIVSHLGAFSWLK